MDVELVIRYAYSTPIKPHIINRRHCRPPDSREQMIFLSDLPYRTNTTVNTPTRLNAADQTYHSG